MFDSISAIFSTHGWLYSALAVIAVASTILIIIIILSENRNPVKSLAWVTVLLLLPVVGLILYVFFGRSIKNTRMISRRSRRKLRRREGHSSSNPRNAGLSSESVQQIFLGRSLTGAQFYTDNTVDVFTSGALKFKALEQDLRNARHTINMQYYIFEDDDIGHRIASILKERVDAGVTVRLIYDHVGSFHVRSRFFRHLRECGIDARPFFKVTFPPFGTRVNWRNHRKLCIVDGTIGYLGGMNVADRYISGGKKFDTWRDTHVRITGPVVQALQYSFAVDWNFMGAGLIEDIPIHQCAIAPYDASTAVTGVGAQMLTSGPTAQWSNISLALQKAISNARRRVYVQTPYFLPTEALLKALQSAALAHVDVRVMMPLHSDSMMLTHASNSYISECLKAGIKIYFYKAGMLHSKMIVVDDEFTTIGSTNFDFRSFDYNFEANLFFYSKALNSAMANVFKKDMAQCDRVEPRQWRSRRLGRRIAESILRLLSPVL